MFREPRRRVVQDKKNSTVGCCPACSYGQMSTERVTDEGRALLHTLVGVLIQFLVPSFGQAACNTTQSIIHSRSPGSTITHQFTSFLHQPPCTSRTSTFYSSQERWDLWPQNSCLALKCCEPWSPTCSMAGAKKRISVTLPQQVPLPPCPSFYQTKPLSTH